MKIQETLKIISDQCTQRYHLTLPRKCSPNTAFPKAYLNNMFRWQSLNKIVLHSTSSKICATPELYASLNLALSCIGGQAPRAQKSKKSVAAFKVMSGALVGCSSSLRKSTLQLFCYKWSFLSPAEQLNGPTNASAIGTNIFVFELGQLDYKAFEPLPGLYIQFDHTHTGDYKSPVNIN